MPGGIGLVQCRPAGAPIDRHTHARRIGLVQCRPAGAPIDRHTHAKRIGLVQYLPASPHVHLWSLNLTPSDLTYCPLRSVHMSPAGYHDSDVFLSCPTGEDLTPHI
jgi:hypothetical protein